VEALPSGALLVPTDMSHVSLPAVAYAADFARRTGGTLVLLHVVSPRESEEGVVDGRYVDQQFEEIRGRLLWWFRTFVPLAARQGVGVETVVCVGHPEHEILTMARAMQAGMIVMATHARRGLRRAVIGSVAEAVLRQAPCPVLAMSPTALQNSNHAGLVPGGQGGCVMHARELMSTPVVTVSPETNLKEVAECMVAHRVSGVPVVDHFGRLVGIISETDLVSKLESEEKRPGLAGLLDHLAQPVGEDRKLHARTAAELMTSAVVTAPPDASVRELIHLMTGQGVNRIPIVESSRVIGIVTRADILRTLVRPDAAITEDVRWRLLHDLWIDPTPLTIDTRDGIVSIAGEAPTRSEAELVKSWAAATEGVVDVDTRGLRYRNDDRRIKLPAGRGWQDRS